MRKDIHNNVDVRVAKTIAAITTDTTTAGAIIDTKDYGAVEFIMLSATITDGTYTPLIEEGDASNLSDAVAVADANLFGTEAGVAFVAADDNAVKKIGYRVGNYRYVRLSFVSTGTTSGGTLGAIAVLGNPNLAPVS